MNRVTRHNPLRVAFVGLGRRGLANMNRYLLLKQAEVAVICDFSEEALRTAKASFPMDYPEPLCYRSWQEMMSAHPEVDLVYISTDWKSHSPIAVSAMEAGYDVAVEVPAVVDVDGASRLLKTVETTGRFFTMVENCCYDPFHLSTLALVEAGLLGSVTHCEGAYIHDLRNDHESGAWISTLSGAGEANPYPTHGIGPICQILRAGGGDDRLDSVVSVSPDIAGINSSLIRTSGGRTVLLQFDVITPRPYSRLQTVCGTRGYVSKYPVPMVMLDGMTEPLTGEALKEFLNLHRHPLLDAYEADGLRLGVPNMMNYIMDRRLFDLLREGKEPDITAAEAVEWSSLAWLTKESIRKAGVTVKIPLWD